MVFQPISPSNPLLFPWLSGISKNYESYKFEQLSFQYQPACSSTLPGLVMMGVDYDAADPPPTSKAQLQSYEDSVKVNSWMECVHVSKKRNLQKYPNYFTDFTVSQDVSVPSANRQNYVGTLTVATIGQGSKPIIGELYVDYTIRLETPQLGQPNGALSLESAGASPWAPFNVTAATQFDFMGDVVLQWPATSHYRALMLQNFQGLVVLVQMGTGVTTHPILTLYGPGTLQLLIANTQSSGSIALYNCSMEPNCEFGITAGTSTTTTKWHLAWVSAKREFLQHIG